MTKPESRSPGSGARDEAVAEAATAWFVRLSSDLAGEEDRRAFGAWLAEDPAHRDAYARAEALWAELGALPDPRPAAARRQGAAGDVASPRRQRRGVRRLAALAACLLLAVLCAPWALDAYDSLRADHVTAVGETSRIALADGSVVELNTDTALAVDFTGERRRIQLFRGEAFFTVAADGKRPFEVSAPGGTARAVGTAFNVQSEGAAMAVAVAEGRVRVSRAAAGEGILLGAGEVLHYAADGRARRSAVDVSALTAWRQGKLVFEDRPLRAVVAQLDRYRPGTIVLLDSTIAGERFSGVVSLADTDRALAAIEGTLPVEIIRITGYLTLLRGRD